MQFESRSNKWIVFDVLTDGLQRADTIYEFVFE